MQSLPYCTNFPLLSRSLPIPTISNTSQDDPTAIATTTTAITSTTTNTTNNNNLSNSNKNTTKSSLLLKVSSSRVLRFSNINTPISINNKNNNTINKLYNKKSTKRDIPLQCYKLLDAPNLADDFYLDLLAWSRHNILSVGLNQTAYVYCIYLLDYIISYYTLLYLQKQIPSQYGFWRGRYST